VRAAVLFAVLLAAACSSETKLRVTPEPADLHPKATDPLPARIALLVHDPRRPEENPYVGPERADVTGDFVTALRDSGLFREVHYPVLSTHRFEMTIEVEQKGYQDVPLGTRLMTLPALVTLGLLGQVCWYSMDSHVDATVRLKVRSDTVATYTATTDVRFSYHYGWKNPDPTKSFRDCIDAAHAQLIRKMIDDRERLAAILSAPQKLPGS